MSGALDRLHYEKDPCVRYDAPRKVWIYLHRGRTEEDFGTGVAVNYVLVKDLGQVYLRFSLVHWYMCVYPGGQIMFLFMSIYNLVVSRQLVTHACSLYNNYSKPRSIYVVYVVPYTWKFSPGKMARTLF